MKSNTFEDIIKQLPYPCRKLLLDLKSLRERPDYHPEPSAYEHVKIVTERLLSLPTDFIHKKELVISALFHDIGKKVCSRPNYKLKDKFSFIPPTSPGHDKFGADLALFYQDELEKAFNCNIEIVHYICSQHMRINSFVNMKTAKKINFFNDVYFKDLCVFSRADDMLLNFTLDSVYNSYENFKNLI